MKQLILILSILAACSGAYGQQFVTGEYTLGSSATTTEVTVIGADRANNAVRSVNLEWISDATGRATITIDNMYGTLERLVFAPVASASPSANYDVVMEDTDALDLFGGKGANLSATTATTSIPLISTAVGTPNNVYQVGHKYTMDGQRVTVKVTNAGNTKRGIIRIFFKN